MLFLIGLDSAILGVVLLWHGMIEENAKLSVFGLAVLLVANGMISFQMNKWAAKIFERLKEMQKRS